MPIKKPRTGKQRKIRFVIEAKPIRALVNFYVGYDLEEVNIWMKKNDYPEIEDEGERLKTSLAFCGETTKDNVIFHIVAIRKYDHSIHDIGIASHEITHAVQNITESKGIDDNETFAYLQEYFLMEFLKKFRVKPYEFKSNEKNKDSRKSNPRIRKTVQKRNNAKGN